MTNLLSIPEGECIQNPIKEHMLNKSEWQKVNHLKG